MGIGLHVLVLPFASVSQAVQDGTRDALGKATPLGAALSLVEYITNAVFATSGIQVPCEAAVLQELSVPETSLEDDLTYCFNVVAMCYKVHVLLFLIRFNVCLQLS